MNKFNEFDLIKTPRNWIDEVTATNFEPTKRAKVIRIKYIFAIVLIVNVLATHKSDEFLYVVNLIKSRINSSGRR